jgi:hypothetical protein
MISAFIVRMLLDNPSGDAAAARHRTRLGNATGPDFLTPNPSKVLLADLFLRAEPAAEAQVLFSTK